MLLCVLGSTCASKSSTVGHEHDPNRLNRCPLFLNHHPRTHFLSMLVGLSLGIYSCSHLHYGLEGRRRVCVARTCKGGTEGRVGHQMHAIIETDEATKQPMRPTQAALCPHEHTWLEPFFIHLVWCISQVEKHHGRG